MVEDMALSEQRIQDLKENRVVPIAALYPHARNYKSHPPEQIRKIKASLERWGQVRSIVIKDDANGSYTIVAGHGVVEAAQQLKMSELHADVFPQWVPDDEIRGYLVADNELGNDAVDDTELLVALLQEQQDAGYGLASMGSDDETLRQMLESLGDEALEDEERTRTTELNEPAGGSVESGYNILIMCETEIEQQRAYDLATKEGFNCKVLTL